MATAAVASADPSSISRIDSIVEAASYRKGSKETTKELKSKWPLVQMLRGPPTTSTFRLEGEVADLVVLGEIPKEIDGTFYRIMIDPFEPPCEGNVPLDGDGNIHALRFKNGKVDMKTKYVETQRYLLERKAGKNLFGLYRNPWTHHPCVRAAVDSTANTNLVYWAGHLLALKESALPYAVDPNTLETKGYDPFREQIRSKAFTAHPKVDPLRGELVVHGYEAKGIASMDLVSYAIDKSGKVRDVFWYKQPFADGKPGLIHDCVITKHWLMLFVWPFSADVERMKKGGHHWAYDYRRKFIVIVSARNPDSPPLGSGWEKGETRFYEWKNCMPIHTAGAWEEENGIVYAESSRVHDNAFPFFPADDGRLPEANTKADFVRWKIDITKPSGTYLEDPVTVLDVPAEFPRMDERFMGQFYNVMWMNVFMSEGAGNVYHGLNGIAMYDRRNGGKTMWYYVGDESMVQEPIFVPRTADAEEGDGYVMALVDRVKEKRSEIVILDTRDLEHPVAIVQMPFAVKSQVHGNWVPSEDMGGWKSLVKEVENVEIIKDGALEML